MEHSIKNQINIILTLEKHYKTPITTILTAEV